MKMRFPIYSATWPQAVITSGKPKLWPQKLPSLPYLTYPPPSSLDDTPVNVYSSSVNPDNDIVAVESVPVESMSIESGTSVTVSPFDVGNYQQSDICVTVDRINDPEIPLRNISASHAANFRDSFCLYGYDYARETITVTPVQKNE